MSPSFVISEYSTSRGGRQFGPAGVKSQGADVCFSSESAGRPVDVDLLPVPVNDAFPDFGGRFPLFVELVGEEGFLEADRTSRRVVGSEAVEQAAVSENLVTVAVAGLLRQHAGDFARDVIRPSDYRAVGKASGGH